MIKPKTCICKNCGNSQLYYQMPTNLFFKTLAIQVYWCHKCETKNYFWPITATSTSTRKGLFNY